MRIWNFNTETTQCRSNIKIEPPHDKTNKMPVRPVWSESSLCAQRVAKDPSFLNADREDSDQTGRMPRLIWVFAGRTCHFVCFVTRRLICLFKITLSCLAFHNFYLCKQWRSLSDIIERDIWLAYTVCLNLIMNFNQNKKKLKNEPRHDKTNKISVRPAKTLICLGIRPVWSESSMCAQWEAKDPWFLYADREDWS